MVSRNRDMHCLLSPSSNEAVCNRHERDAGPLGVSPSAARNLAGRSLTYGLVVWIAGGGGSTAAGAGGSVGSERAGAGFAGRARGWDEALAAAAGRGLAPA